MVIKFGFSSKHSQTEVIVTILLILIGIVAVGFVSVFIIGIVKDNLRGTECFQTTGQLKINLDDYTFYSDDALGKVVHLSIERGEAKFNLTGLNVVISSGDSSSVVEIRNGKTITGVSMYGSSGDLVVPPPLLKNTYNITVTSAVSHVKIVPVISVESQERLCSEGAIESDIPSR